MLLVNYLKSLNEGTEITTTANLGYVYTPNCIRRCLRLSQEEKLLLFEIYSLYNENKGYAFPTQQTLAMYLGVTSSSVSKSLKKLEEKEFIQSWGRKGKKKRYRPRLDIHTKPYMILSETFHFATKIINEKVPEDIDGNWGNKLLQFVNVSKKDEFTERDPYGRLLNDFHPNSSIDELLTLITEYVSQLFSITLEINWKEEIANNKIKNEKRKKGNKSSFKGGNKQQYDYKDADITEQWLIDIGAYEKD